VNKSSESSKIAIYISEQTKIGRYLEPSWENANKICQQKKMVGVPDVRLRALQEMPILG